MTWLKRWEPEDPHFWKTEGSAIAWRTCGITTFALIASFATWFVVSAVVVRLPQIGFKFTPMQLFWLAAMPGLSGGTFRIFHAFIIPIFGTRTVITASIFIKLIPMVWLGYAVQNPATPYWQFFVISLLCGFGGGDFSSYMPSTSLFFPKRLQGVSLGLQAGIGNFGIGITQFVAPWIITFPALGAIAGGPQVFRKGEIVKDMWLQNAAFWFVPYLILAGVIAWIWLRSVPIKATLAQQFDIFGRKNRAGLHTFNCTWTYVMTFGSFAGFSAAFPLMIKTLYSGFPNGPDALKYAWMGPAIGGAVRAITGAPFDKIGGSIGIMISGIGLVIGCGALVFGGYLAPTSLDQFPGFLYLMLWIFFMTGVGNAATFRQYPIVFAYSPRQGAGVIGWTAAIAAYGPFIFSSLIGASITRTGSASPFFIGAAIFYVVGTVINWHFYTKPGAERGDWGNKWGTWWDRAKDTWPSEGGARYAK